MDDIMKKHKEYLVLTRIYNKNNLTIKSTENPDFIIESDSDKFGVEIT